MRSCVVIPTYNEKENIEEVIRRVLKNDVDLLIVDDSSPDGTGDIVIELSKEYNGRLSLETRKEKLGLGKAYIYGFSKCLEKKYDIICQMDADLSHNPDVLGELIQPISEARADLVIGSRYVQGGQIPKWSLIRRLLSRGGNLYTRIMLKIKTRDATAGYRAYNAKILKKMLDNGISSEGYGFQIEMTYTASKFGATIIEVPISFAEREKGVSKMGGIIIVEALKNVTIWSLRDRLWKPVSKLFTHRANIKVDISKSNDDIDLYNSNDGEVNSHIIDTENRK